MGLRGRIFSLFSKGGGGNLKSSEVLLRNWPAIGIVVKTTETIHWAPEEQHQDQRHGKKKEGGLNEEVLEDTIKRGKARKKYRVQGGVRHSVPKGGPKNPQKSSPIVF